MNSENVLKLLEIIIPALVRMVELLFPGDGRGLAKRAAVIKAASTIEPAADPALIGRMTDAQVSLFNASDWRDVYDSRFRRGAA